MKPIFELSGVVKRYGRTLALDDVTLAVPSHSIVGLVGRNGSGKTTLLRHVMGLVLPDHGECVTLGRPASKLGRSQLSRMGVVHQGDQLLKWMLVGQLLKYVSSFYETWDHELERYLLTELELDPGEKVGLQSPGILQKLSLVLATCHRPELLLLDEPLSDLDPIARQSVLALLLDRFSSDEMTIVLSSHMLHDIEPVVDRVVCLEAGRVVADDELDNLKERFTEWVVMSPEGELPRSYPEPYVLSSWVNGRRARLLVRDGESHRAEFANRHGVTVESRSLNLDELFHVLVTTEWGNS